MRRTKTGKYKYAVSQINANTTQPSGSAIANAVNDAHKQLKEDATIACARDLSTCEEVGASGCLPTFDNMILKKMSTKSEPNGRVFDFEVMAEVSIDIQCTCQSRTSPKPIGNKCQLDIRASIEGQKEYAQVLPCQPPTVSQTEDAGDVAEKILKEFAKSWCNLGKCSETGKRCEPTVGKILFEKNRHYTFTTPPSCVAYDTATADISCSCK